jgi:hypothetical protein
LPPFDDEQNNFNQHHPMPITTATNSAANAIITCIIELLTPFYLFL